MSSWCCQASCLACSAPSSNLIVALLGEQLFRAALRRSQIAGFLRRLGSDRAVVPERAREEAAAVGIALAEACWPVVLPPGVGTLKPADLEAIDREARRLAPGGLTVALRGCAVLLMPASEPAPACAPASCACPPTAAERSPRARARTSRPSAASCTATRSAIALHKALEILGDDLEDAEMRLAVHVVLKLHRAR